MSHRKAGEEIARKERAHEMMAKIKRSQKAVDAFMKEQAHRNMLVQEERKLHDEDMRLKHEQNRRLATKKKNEIMTKEEKDK